MSLLSQKQAVIDAVTRALGAGYDPTRHKALDVLSDVLLESVKVEITLGILQGTIQYGKDRTNVKEVTPYARSMVMNHLKKAKELSGNQVPSDIPVGNLAKSLVKANDSKTHKGVDTTLLPEALASYVKTL